MHRSRFLAVPYIFFLPSPHPSFRLLQSQLFKKKDRIIDCFNDGNSEYTGDNWVPEAVKLGTQEGTSSKQGHVAETHGPLPSTSRTYDHMKGLSSFL